MKRGNHKKIEQDVLFIPAMSRDELLQPGSVPAVIDQFVDGLDLEVLESRYSPDGASSYSPRALLKVVLLAYCENTYACRRIADKVKYDLRYSYMCGYRHPSHNTINRFRSERLGLEGTMSVFQQLVDLLSGKGLVDIEDIYIDGTTLESRASRHRIVWSKTQRRYAKDNKKKIEGLMQQVGLLQAHDAAPGKPAGDGGADRPEGGADQPEGDVHLSAGETAAIREQVASLPDSSAKTELKERLDKADRYRKEDAMCGTRSGTATTDPDSVAMHPKEDTLHKGPCLPMYNAMVASSNQYILFTWLFGLPTDTQAFPFFLAGLKSAFGDRLKNATGDAAFGSEVNVLLAEGQGVGPYFKHTMYATEHTPSYKPDPYQPQNFQRNDDGTLSCPAGRTLRKIKEKTQTKHGIVQTSSVYRCDSCKYCRHKAKCLKQGKVAQPREVSINERWWHDVKPRLDSRLDSEEGREKLKKRSLQIEPCFSFIKWAGTYKRFRHFGWERCLMDLNIKSLAVNLKKYAAGARKALHGRLFLPCSVNFEPFSAPLAA